MAGTRYPDKSLTSVVKVNSPIYVFSVRDINQVYGVYYTEGDICYDKDSRIYWRLDEDVRPYMSLNTTQKTLFCMGPTCGSGEAGDDVYVSLYAGDTHGYLTQKIVAGSGISFTVGGAAPNEHIIINADYRSVETFLELTDTPSTYAGASQWIVRVNTAETALEFVNPATAFDDKFVKTSLVDPATNYLVQKVKAGTNVTVTEIANPAGNWLEIQSQDTLPTGFEYRGTIAGDGAGWSLINRVEANYGTPGAWAIDGSFATGDPDYQGAIGNNSVAFGYDVEPDAFGALAGGYQVKIWDTAVTGIAWGYGIDLSGYSSAAFGYNVKAGLQIGQAVSWTGYLLAPEAIVGTADTYADYGLTAGRNHVVTTDFALVAGSNNYVLDDVVGLGFLSVIGSSNRVSARYSSVFGFGNIIEAEGGFVSGQNIHIEKIVPGSVNTNDQSKMNFVGGWGKYTPTWANTWKITVRGHANLVWTDARTKDVTMYGYDCALIGGSDTQITTYWWNNIYLGLVNRNNTHITQSNTTWTENLAILTAPAIPPISTSTFNVLKRNTTTGVIEEVTLSVSGTTDQYVGVSATDTPDFLDAKLVAGDGITIIPIGPAGSEQLEIASTLSLDYPIIIVENETELEDAVTLINSAKGGIILVAARIILTHNHSFDLDNIIIEGISGSIDFGGTSVPGTGYTITITNGVPTFKNLSLRQYTGRVPTDSVPMFIMNGADSCVFENCGWNNVVPLVAPSGTRYNIRIDSGSSYYFYIDFINCSISTEGGIADTYRGLDIYYNYSSGQAGVRIKGQETDIWGTSSSLSYLFRALGGGTLNISTDMTPKFISHVGWNLTNPIDTKNSDTPVATDEFVFSRAGELFSTPFSSMGTSFLTLSDVDDSDYTGKSGYTPRVNVTETGLELLPITPSQLALDYQWDTNTAASDPGNGQIKGNNATYSSITELYMNDETQYGNDATAAIEALHPGDVIAINDVGNHTTIVVMITTHPTDNTGWYTIPVTVLVYNGTSYTNNEDITVELLYVPTRNFIQLDDAPSSYSGDAGQIPIVNATETALEFAPALFGEWDASNIALIPREYSADLDDIESSGIYHCTNTCTNMPTGATTGDLIVMTELITPLGQRSTQIFVDESGNLYTRKEDSNIWNDWKSFVDERIELANASTFSAVTGAVKTIIHSTYSTTGAQTITLSSAAALVDGITFSVKDAAGNAGTYSITIATEGSETIDGESTAVIAGNYGTITVYAYGGDWFIKH